MISSRQRAEFMPQVSLLMPMLSLIPPLAIQTESRFPVPRREWHCLPKRERTSCWQVGICATAAPDARMSVSPSRISILRVPCQYEATTSFSLQTWDKPQYPADATGYLSSLAKSREGLPVSRQSRHTDRGVPRPFSACQHSRIRSDSVPMVKVYRDKINPEVNNAGGHSTTSCFAHRGIEVANV